MYDIVRAAEKGKGGQIAPDPQPICTTVPNLRNSLKLRKPHQNRGECMALRAPLRNILNALEDFPLCSVFLLFENDDVIRAPDILFSRAPEFSRQSGYVYVRRFSSMDLQIFFQWPLTSELAFATNTITL